VKLLLAIINNDDSAAVTSALTHENIFVTRLSTNGGFLLAGNTTLLIGIQNDQVERAKSIIRKFSSARVQSVPSTEALGSGLQNDGLPHEVRVGGATIFTIAVEDMEKF